MHYALALCAIFMRYVVRAMRLRYTLYIIINCVCGYLYFVFWQVVPGASFELSKMCAAGTGVSYTSDDQKLYSKRKNIFSGAQRHGKDKKATGPEKSQPARLAL